jgi:hypothetical protein
VIENVSIVAAALFMLTLLLTMLIGCANFSLEDTWDCHSDEYQMGALLDQTTKTIDVSSRFLFFF